MFVIVYKNSVILGPSKWSPLRFAKVIQEDLETTLTLPSQNDNNQALIINNDLKILPVVEAEKPQFNSKIEFLHGPFWVFTNTEATASYIVQSKTVEAVKNQLKEKVAFERYRKEVNGTKVTIGTTEVNIATDRDTRNLFVQKFSSMSDADTINWKFATTWLNLSKTDIQLIISSVNTYVQTQFDWEMTKSQEIDNCTTLQELDAVVIEELQNDRIVR